MKMLKLTEPDGQEVYIVAQNVMAVTERMTGLMEPSRLETRVYVGSDSYFAVSQTLQEVLDALQSI